MNELLQKQLFWEKYRPNTLDDTILPSRIKNLAKHGIQGNYLFHGTPGLGKTTLAKILLKDYSNDEYLVVHGKMGVDELRNKVYNFCTAMIPFSDPNKLRVVYFEEFDNATKSLQEELKSFVESHEKRVRFIATCNNMSKITDPIKSRFIEIDFTPDKEEKKKLMLEFYNRVKSILEKEEISIEDTDLKKIVKNRFPDFRKVWQDIQQLHLSGTNSSVADVNSDDTVLFDKILNPTNSVETWEYLYTNWLDSIDTAFFNLGRNFYEYVSKRHMEKIDRLGNTMITVTKYTDEKLPNCLDPFVTLCALVYELQEIYK